MQLADTKEQLVEYIDKVPGFSSTVAKVIQLINDPMSNPRDLIQTISLDPVLTGKILKLINSAYFGLGDKVVSLNRAVVMLGLNTIKNLALSSSLLSNLKMKDNFKWFSPDEFWEHSLGCAVGAKAVATRMGIPVQEREEYFVAGLLHDIGKIIFVQYLTEEYTRVVDPDFKKGIEKPRLEEEEFGIDHAELGLLMARKWELPPVLQETIKAHHDLSLASDEYARVCASVHLSNYVCNKFKVGIKNQVEAVKLNPQTFEILGLGKSEVKEVFSNLEEKVEKASIFIRQ